MQCVRDARAPHDPVFPGGDTPQGLADMTGNVWEWTSSLYRPYLYDAKDGREDPETANVRRVLRGGSWLDGQRGSRCAYRDYGHPGDRDDVVGFRLVRVSPIA
jgi:formylglycine-generating enzyme required for sulfatase activity